MRWTSLLAIFVLFWVMSAFLVMPFGIRTHDELGLEKVAGQAQSAPANFSPRLILRRATLLALVLCGLFYENYVHRWVTWQDIDISPLIGLTNGKD